MFLTDEELFTLTGYRQPSKQVAHLRAQRIPFHINRAGHPRVVRAAIEGGSRGTVEKASKPAWAPSWAASRP